LNFVVHILACVCQILGDGSGNISGLPKGRIVSPMREEKK